MADETPWSGEREDPALGAGESAPTAPHATPGSRHHIPTGPERFWTSPWKRAIAVTCFVASAVIHYVLTPWSLLPEHEFEIRDVAGELAIPVDIFEGDNAPPPPPVTPPLPAADTPHPAVPKGEGLDAGAPPLHREAGADAHRPPRHPDAGAPTDAAPTDASFREGGGTRRDDGGIARGGPASGVARDAVGMIGAAGAAQAGPQNVVLTLNMAAIRAHPVGRRIGPLFAAIPQWDDFLVGTGVDPLRDTDWMSVNGPSLIHSEKDVIMLHYSASDAVVDRALDVVGRKATSGGPYDAGVRGVKAVLGHADRADRVFLRPQPHVLAVVPPSYAATAARILAKASIPRTPKRPTEALRLTLVHPHGPMPAIPESVTELRLWIIPKNADGGADIYAEGDTATSDLCHDAVSVLRAVIRDQNSFGVKLLTHGLLDNVELTSDGAMLHMHIPVVREQLEVILAFAAGRLGVDIAPLEAGAPGQSRSGGEH